MTFTPGPGVKVVGHRDNVEFKAPLTVPPEGSARDHLEQVILPANSAAGQSLWFWQQTITLAVEPHDEWSVSLGPGERGEVPPEPRLTDLAELDDRQFKALTGLSPAAFFKLVPVFEASASEIKQENYEKNQANRKRKPGAGPKGKLKTMERKLFFILYYLKVYPTFDVLGYHFGLDRSKAWTNVQQLLPVLLKSLDKLEVLPQRQFNSVDEIRHAFAGVQDLFIDATERPHWRPQDEQAQKEKYSGKKKSHTVKNTLITNACKMILFLGYTVFGSRHDYGLLKSEFPPDLDWFKTFKLWVDLGYVGLQKDYDTLELNIPHKKPRKSKANPAPTLTAEQKEENRRISQIRVVVENAICGMKKFNILVNKFRNRKENFVDDVAVAAAGLFNWTLTLNQASLT